MPRLPRRPSRHRAFTLIETLISLVLIAVLFSILLPALSSARVSSHRDGCADNLRIVGEAWQTFLADHDREFPYVPVQPGWFYGGMRFSRVDGTAFPDYNRPLTPYLHLFRTAHVQGSMHVLSGRSRHRGCGRSAGTGSRTAFESFGTSYRANAPLLDARAAGLTDELRGMRRSEIRAFPAALVVCGDAVWYEVAESTGRTADWHGEPNAGNLLFLDGSVQFMTITPKSVRGPIMFDPLAIRSMTATIPEPQSQPDRR